MLGRVQERQGILVPPNVDQPPVHEVRMLGVGAFAVENLFEGGDALFPIL